MTKSIKLSTDYIDMTIRKIDNINSNCVRNIFLIETYDKKKNERASVYTNDLHEIFRCVKKHIEYEPLPF